MSIPPPRTPAECFATILRWLSLAVAARSAAGLAAPTIALILGRIRGIGQRFADLAARIGAGSYVPRRCSPAPRPRTGHRPRSPNKLPQTFGWLLPLVPEAVGYRSQLEYLLRDPDMAALLAAAPASLGRPLRSLCWMLRLRPPDRLAAPARPRPPPKTAAAAVPRPPLPQAPAWMRKPSRRRGWSLARICGPPLPHPG